MAVLILDQKSSEAIKKVKTFARKNITTKEHLKEMGTGKREPIGDEPDYVCYINPYYRIVYSIEDQPIGLCHHFSISQDDNNLPPIPIVMFIMEEFDIHGAMTDHLHIWIEEMPNGKKVANILSKFDNSLLNENNQ